MRLLLPPLILLLQCCRMHPSDHGHQVLAELLAAPLMRAVWEATAGDALSEADHRRHPRLPDLPAPMIPDTADEIPGVCAMLASAGWGPAPAPAQKPCMARVTF